MKLLMCQTCGDIFNLNFKLKTCSCGEVKGKYTTNSEAVVNGAGVSLAIGTGSLWKAILEVNAMTEDFRGYGKNPWLRQPTSLIAWVRPHEGPANAHTTIDPNLGKEPS